MKEEDYISIELKSKNFSLQNVLRINSIKNKINDLEKKIKN